jgi:hypothetical protein
MTSRLTPLPYITPYPCTPELRVTDIPESHTVHLFFPNNPSATLAHPTRFSMLILLIPFMYYTRYPMYPLYIIDLLQRPTLAMVAWVVVLALLESRLWAPLKCCDVNRHL